VDPYQYLAVGRFHQALVDRERPYRGRAVATVPGVVHHGRAHVDLGEGVVHIGVRVGRRTDDARLGEGRDTAADAVELPPVRVGTPERGQQDAVALRARRRKVAVVEDEAAAGAAAHVNGANLLLSH
jgi:hypothetical protein